MTFSCLSPKKKESKKNVCRPPDPQFFFCVTLNRGTFYFGLNFALITSTLIWFRFNQSSVNYIHFNKIQLYLYLYYWSRWSLGSRAAMCSNPTRSLTKRFLSQVSQSHPRCTPPLHTPEYHNDVIPSILYFWLVNILTLSENPEKNIYLFENAKQRENLLFLGIPGISVISVGYFLVFD